MVSSVTTPPEIKRGHFRIGQRGHYCFGLTHKDQLVALRGLLRQHTDLPQTLLDQLIERPALTTSQCRAYFEAYAADPGRFVDPPAAPPASPTPPPPTDGSDRLSGYAAVLPSVQEVTCGLH